MPLVAQGDIFSFAESVDLLIVFGHRGQGGIDVAWSKFRERFPSVDPMGEAFTSIDSTPREYSPRRFVVTVAEERNQGMSDERLRNILERYFSWAEVDGLRHIATNGIMDIDHSENTDANRASDDRRARLLFVLASAYERKYKLKIFLSSLNDVFVRGVERESADQNHQVLAMAKKDFLDNPDVKEFLDFFSRCMKNLEVQYDSQYTGVRRNDPSFHIKGVQDALASYAWPAKDTFNPPARLYDWGSTSGFLGRARRALHNAITNGDEPATWNAAIKILEWGLTPNGVKSNKKRLGEIAEEKAIALWQYLEGVRASIALATCNTASITANLIPYASSGICKIHSLASTDGLIIFDSRVAATLGECINEYLRRKKAEAIPSPLRIFVELRHNRTNPGQRRPRPLANGQNHNGFSQNHRWIECQVRISWLFEEALTKNPGVFDGFLLPERMHRLEAACFMMGAYLTPGPFAGRSFNFANV